MTRRFDTENLYRGVIVSRVKAARQAADPRKRDLSPAVLDFGPVRFVLARHFGFCYGVENAIEAAYAILDQHPDRRVLFLSEMIHNPRVNEDLRGRGVRFVFAPSGDQLVAWDALGPDDIVVVPAFGTTLEMQKRLSERGIDPYTYNTTCPFVEKVWRRSAELGDDGFTVVVHGKATHEETRATFSHSARSAPTMVVLDVEEAGILADVITGRRDSAEFVDFFGDKCSEGFEPVRDLDRIGVVNQTTMLATETRRIASLLRRAMARRYGDNEIDKHFADTSDTLCYATNENQNATIALARHGADVAIVVGGYNSSNTSHIVELCGKVLPTYFIGGAHDLGSREKIRHFNLTSRRVETSHGWLPTKPVVDVVMTGGASCPDVLLDHVLLRVLSFFEGTRPVDDVLSGVEATPGGGG